MLHIKTKKIHKNVFDLWHNTFKVLLFFNPHFFIRVIRNKYFLTIFLQLDKCYMKLADYQLLLYCILYLSFKCCFLGARKPNNNRKFSRHGGHENYRKGNLYPIICNLLQCFSYEFLLYNNFSEHVYVSRTFVRISL